MKANKPVIYFEDEKDKQCSLIPCFGEKKLTPEELKKVIEEKNKKVSTASSDVSIQAFNPKGVNAIGAPLMWNKGIDGTGVLVAIVDTGIATHADLKSKVVVRRLYTGESGEPLNNHGTHVAGTVAANGAIRGVAYKALLGDYRVLDNNGSGNYDWIVRAIYDAVYDGCAVISMSLGGPYDYPPLRSAIQYAFNANVPVIVAAGNEGDGSMYTNEFSYPAMYSTTQSVGAVDYNGTLTKPANFTNTNYEVDCCSQGVSVVSTVPGGNYAYLSGTSMATPHIAGAAALIIHQYRKAGRNYTTANIYADLAALAKDIHVLGRDNSTGKGFVTFKPTL